MDVDHESFFRTIQKVLFLFQRTWRGTNYICSGSQDELVMMTPAASMRYMEAGVMTFVAHTVQNVYV